MADYTGREKFHHETKCDSKSFIHRWSSVESVEKIHPTRLWQKQNSGFRYKGHTQGGEPMKVTDQKGPEFEKSITDALRKLGQAKKEEREPKMGGKKSG